jgi:hypothetical protein
MAPDNSLQRTGAHFHSQDDVYVFIDRYKEELPVKAMCDVFKVSRSGYSHGAREHPVGCFLRLCGHTLNQLFRSVELPKPAPRTTYRYSGEFNATAVRLTVGEPDLTQELRNRSTF